MPSAYVTVKTYSITSWTLTLTACCRSRMGGSSTRFLRYVFFFKRHVQQLPKLALWTHKRCTPAMMSVWPAMTPFLHCIMVYPLAVFCTVDTYFVNLLWQLSCLQLFFCCIHSQVVDHYSRKVDGLLCLLGEVVPCPNDGTGMWLVLCTGLSLRMSWKSRHLLIENTSAQSPKICMGFCWQRHTKMQTPLNYQLRTCERCPINVSHNAAHLPNVDTQYICAGKQHCLRQKHPEQPSLDYCHMSLVLQK